MSEVAAKKQSQARKSSALKDESTAGEEWLTTFADMMTLLMTFFVLLFSMSTIDPVKLQQFGESLGTQEGSTRPSEKLVSLSEISRDIQQVIAQEQLGSMVQVSMTSRGVTMGIASDLAFGVGSSDLSDQIKDFLSRLIPTMQQATYNIAVEGHTDNVPIRSQRFPSNWELSASRASAVIRFLVEQGVAADKLRAIGYGDTRPKASNDTEAGRERNRRVDITFLSIG
ncbi:MAG: flagellar motor protein MotB [Candidatus Marinimicrobia bacterium]|nr:flagellar motor protein MotB [Candidatus Neomarinimicrobiota bacterium]MCF7839844.1 flagellar motor protein MotB [Candidatus Neomarinimicrobiota bacterium]